MTTIEGAAVLTSGDDFASTTVQPARHQQGRVEALLERRPPALGQLAATVQAQHADISAA